MSIESAILRAKLNSAGFCEISLSGRCMEPFLVAGDKARIVQGGSDNIKIGGIALVELENGLIALHRIVDIQGNLLTTKGDYSGKTEQIDKERILGIAKEFSDDGMRWAHDKRTSEEIMSLVQLSKALSDRSDDLISQRRAEIWSQNEGARMRMFEECD